MRANGRNNTDGLGVAIQNFTRLGSRLEAKGREDGVTMRSARRGLGLFGAIVAVAVFGAGSAWGVSSGYHFKSGAVGLESDCTDCHDAARATNPGVLSIDAPETYSLGETYPITVTLIGATDRAGNAPLRWGYSMSVTGSETVPAGTLTPQGPEVKVATRPGLDYDNVTHTFCSPNGCPTVLEEGEVTPVPGWVVDWTAPSEDVGVVAFWVAANAANGGSDSGDAIFTSVVVATLPEPTAGLAALAALSTLAALRRRA